MGESEARRERASEEKRGQRSPPRFASSSTRSLSSSQPGPACLLARLLACWPASRGHPGVFLFFPSGHPPTPSARSGDKARGGHAAVTGARPSETHWAPLRLRPLFCTHARSGSAPLGPHAALRGGCSRSARFPPSLRPSSPRVLRPPGPGGGGCTRGPWPRSRCPPCPWRMRSHLRAGWW